MVTHSLLWQSMIFRMTPWLDQTVILLLAQADIAQEKWTEVQDLIHVTESPLYVHNSCANGGLNTDLLINSSLCEVTKF